MNRDLTTTKKKNSKQDFPISKKDNTSEPSRVFPRMQDWLNTQKIHVIQQINRTKGEIRNEILHQVHKKHLTNVIPIHDKNPQYYFLNDKISWYFFTYLALYQGREKQR